MKDAQEISDRLYVLIKEIDEVYRTAEQAQQSAEVGLEEVEFLRAKTLLSEKAKNAALTGKELDALCVEVAHGARLRTIELLTIKRRYEHDINRIELEIGTLRGLMSMETAKVKSGIEMGDFDRPTSRRRIQ